MNIDPEALAASLQRVIDTGDETNLRSVLSGVVSACVDLFGVSGSGLMLADDTNVLRYVAASDGPGRQLEILEAEHGEGPCTDTFVNNEPTFTSDLDDDDRWPHITAAVVPLGVRAVMGVPVRLGGVPVGSLDVYLDKAHVWDSSERRALIRYSDIIEATLSSALAAQRAGDLAAQLQYALDNRVVIERAIGFLMSEEKIDAVAAFNRLRLAARSSRRKVGQVAHHLLSTGEVGD